MRKLWNASVAVVGRSSISVWEGPFRVRMASFVLGEIVVRTSTDMMTVFRFVVLASRCNIEWRKIQNKMEIDGGNTNESY